MNQISAFEYIDSSLERFQDTEIFYTKLKNKDQLLLNNTIISFHIIYKFRYNKETNTILIFHSENEYSGIRITIIGDSMLGEKTFELFEWLTTKLVKLAS